MSPGRADDVIATLERRFHAHINRHPGITWDEVAARLAQSPAMRRTVAAMEGSGGEPDVVMLDSGPAFVDCAAESPVGRRSLCYDAAALQSRKHNKPSGAAVETALAMGADLLTEADYFALQAVGEFDGKTSSWVSTPQAFRARGGALFCDRRFGRVFVYCNGAESYYAARGFRACVRLSP